MEDKTNDTEQKRSNELSHASRRVILHNIFKWSKTKDVEKLLKSIKETIKDKIEIEKFKKPPKDNWVTITFEKDEMADIFVKAVNDGTFKTQRGTRRPLFARSASQQDNEVDEKDGKRKREGKEIYMDKRPKIIYERLTDDEIRDAMTSLWRKSYEDQLKWKWRLMTNKCIKKVVQEIKTIFSNREGDARRNDHVKLYHVYDWLNQNPAVEVHPIISSPLITEYRNKIELAFGYTYPTEKTENETASVPIVGFTTKGWSGPLSHPHPCQNTPQEACGIANVVNQFLATSPIPPYNSSLHQGVWRLLIMRFSKRNKECMLIIQHAPPSGGAGKREDGKDDYSMHWEEEKKRLIKMLTVDECRPIPTPEIIYPDVPYEHKDDKVRAPTIGNLPPASTLITSNISTSCAKANLPKVDNEEEEKLNITAIYFQEFDGLSNPKPEHPVQHVYGSTAIKERLGQCQFQISPGAFFQVNTEGAEVLYNVIVQKIKEVTCANGANPKDALLFDVCCGTGTIGLTCLKEGAVGKVIGIDISEPAIKDANINAELNGYKNDSKENETTKFIASRAELVLGHQFRDLELDKEQDKVFVAVVDPAREGLHNAVIKTLRFNEAIRRLIYVSCNPTGSFILDAAMLCGPPSKKYPGTPFRPTSAQPVDMFPLTPHCELVMVFDRIAKDDLVPYNKH